MRRVVYFTVLLPHGSNKVVGRHKATDKGPAFLPQGISGGGVGPLMTKQTKTEGGGQDFINTRNEVFFHFHAAPF